MQMEGFSRSSPMSSILNNNFDNILVQPVASAPVKIFYRNFGLNGLLIAAQGLLTIYKNFLENSVWK